MGPIQLLIAQQAADDTGQTIRLIIMGLLAVALLLALLTAWYWRRTDPKHRLRDPLADVGRSDSPATAATTAAAATSATSPGAVRTGAPVQPSVPGVDDGADEWLRLTGPQALRRGQ